MADADVKPDVCNISDNPTERNKTNESGDMSVDSDEARNASQEQSSRVVLDDSLPLSVPSNEEGAKDTEETKKQLDRMREELVKAKEESARAKDEVERAKKDLAEAKQDTSQIQDAVLEADNVDKAEQKVENLSEVPVSGLELNASQTEAESQSQPLCYEESSTIHDSASDSNQNQENSEMQGRNELSTEHESIDQDMSINTTKNGDNKDHLQQDYGADEESGSDDEHNQDVEEGEEEEEDVQSDDDQEEDGEEGPAKPLDDDEDRRNPQYIPKRGGFYEHDDRTREEEEAQVEPPAAEEKPKKNLRSEAVERWGHDMYDETQQGPKSDNELVTVYGYDIRQEEGAPRARRRRRYGRGPNKYDRTWEDEEAYSRPRGRGLGRGGTSRASDVRRQPQRQEPPKNEDFPPLNDQRKESKHKSENSATAGHRGEGEDANESNERRAVGNKANAISFRRGGGGRTFEERGNSKSTKLRAETSEKQIMSNQDSSGTKDIGLKDFSKSTRGRSDSSRGVPRGNAQARGSSRGTGTSGRGRGFVGGRTRQGGGESSNWREEEEPQPTRSAAHHHGSGRTFHGQQHNAQADNHRGFDEARGRGRGKFGRQGESNDQGIVAGIEQVRIDSHAQAQPVRHQDATRSKRYSSQRQRMTTPPPAAAVATSMAQAPYSVTGGGNATYYAPYNDSPPPNYVQTAPAPILPMAVATQGAPPAYIGPPMYPAGPGPTPFPGAPYQGYPSTAGPPPVQVGVPIGSPTQDNMYGGGIMYYDPGRQPIRHGAQPPRRAKAAIPIVAPDEEIDSYMVTGRPSNHE